MLIRAVSAESRMWQAVTLVRIAARFGVEDVHVASATPWPDAMVTTSFRVDEANEAA